MNSVEIAKKLIGENKEQIAWLRDCEKASRAEVEKLESQIKALEVRLNGEKANLASIRDEKKEYLVNNLALQQFIANGGGLDMLD